MQFEDKYLPTGNEMVSIPGIRESDAGIMGITFLHMGYKGMIEITGDDTSSPFLKPYITVNGVEANMYDITWDRYDHWIPCFRSLNNTFQVSGLILAPIGERGFIVQLRLRHLNDSPAEYSLGLKGCWKNSNHVINESKVIHAEKYVYRSLWNQGLVFDLRREVSIFSFAPISEGQLETEYYQENDSDAVFFSSYKKAALSAEEELVTTIYWGFGFEEVGAATAAKEMMRKGYQYELKATRNWLQERIKSVGSAELDRILNMNMFFNFFFATGVTMDTEEFVLVTSRSPKYYVSAAYWDRDSLLWSFPSVLMMDPGYAGKMLEYAFTKQSRNFGTHSRYIDGTVLEPGFELDELCAPVIALYQYIKCTGDASIAAEPIYRKGIGHILTILETKRHPDYELYETFLQPTDDVVVYPYLTYNNALVWKVFKCLLEIFLMNGDAESGMKMSGKAERIRNAILERCIVDYKGKKIFAWSVDLNGHWNVYDEPPGSLQLLTYYGFCESDDPVYINTVEEIREPGYKFSFSDCAIPEIGCEHAPHPWVLSIANSLLCKRTEHCRSILVRAEMDNGIACESIDENTGRCATGEAFATCAGFLAYAFYYAFSE